MNQTLFVTKFFENWTKTKTKNYLWSMFLWNWKSIEETIFFFFTIHYFHNFINEFCHTFMMYKLLLKLTRTVVRNYRVLCMYNNESFTQTFWRILFAKMRTTSCILQRYIFLQDSNDDLLSMPFTITHAQRNITSAASRANDMPYMIGKRFFPLNRYCL